MSEPTVAALNNQIIRQYQPKFENIWKDLVQQNDSRFAMCTDYKAGISGEVCYVDQLRPIDVEEIGQRMQETVLEDIDTEVRAIYPRRFHSVRAFDEYDEIQLAQQSLPTSETFGNMRKGMNRTMDDVVIEALLGTAKTGKGGGTDVPLPAGQILGDGVAPFSLNLWLDIKQKFEELEVTGQDADGEMPYIALSAAQLRSLYDETKITSTDFASDMEALYRGEIDQFLGFKVVRSERLPRLTNVRSCIAWVPSGIAMRVWDNTNFKLSIRDDFNEAVQLRGKAMFGSSRLEEEKVIEIQVGETGADIDHGSGLSTVPFAYIPDPLP